MKSEIIIGNFSCPMWALIAAVLGIAAAAALIFFALASRRRRSRHPQEDAPADDDCCCAVCDYACAVPGDPGKMTCRLRGEVGADASCRKFVPDPLKRKASRARFDSGFPTE